MRLSVEKIERSVEKKIKMFLQISIERTISLSNINRFDGGDYKRNNIYIFFHLLIMKGIFNEYSDQQYPLLLRNDVKKVTFRVNLGTKD